MLSGNGRHRRPRQAPALVVAAGVTGSAIAIPLLGATGAHAADAVSWDRVAECETGGAWSQNSGNGYYGGLQLSQADWERFGGLDYAPSPDQASRSQQIRVAEQVLGEQGVAAWPTCGPLAGLGSGSASIGVDAGTAGGVASATPQAPGSSGLAGLGPSTSGSSPSASPSPSADASSGASGESSGYGDSSGSGAGGNGQGQSGGNSSADGAKGGESGNSDQGAGSSGLAETGDDGSGRHRGDSAEEGAAEGRGADRSGRHASRGDGGARDLPDGSYTVRAGDNLWGIADSLDVDGGWPALYAGNKDVVGIDPDHIVPGQTLEIPGESVDNQG
ncbi:transglycosylase family protein [Streptomyces tagetis]|uniref:Transglycosylase family protein n=1 Tax=Streptomyces tagetis TaxID=2820809 RepID=A0A941B2K3_9ACTN|nr:transglycosylase family protein [Streptomyces sp. RG38]MBQ0829510.1 transglycosylase family protein [Streptomyces sp. RG38]